MGLLESRGVRAGVLLSIPQCTEQPPQQRPDSPKMATVPRPRNPALALILQMSAAEFANSRGSRNNLTGL